MSAIGVAAWTEESMPDLSDRVAVVTGANSGLGLETARMLAARGAEVVMACRNPEKAAVAATRIRELVPDARLSFVLLDTSSLESVRQAAEAIRMRVPRLDLLINNAGAARKHRELSPDGFEMTFAANHLGHFALTGLLADRLAILGARVVTVTSWAHLRGAIDFDDLHFEHRPYQRMTAYTQSKLANMLFAQELQRRLGDNATISVAAHPGAVFTNFVANMPFPRVGQWLAARRGRQRFLTRTNTVEVGALSTVRAAVDPEVRGGELYGPRAVSTGHPVRVEYRERAGAAQTRARLWAVSEQLTGVRFPCAPGA
ncbi:oxidoreductase [Nocardia lijiangensis]|uniref:oxidoreductase n=1 Tax=Nocardia lijiangensis TaxID=299618 RepID=UPI003D73B005